MTTRESAVAAALAKERCADVHGGLRYLDACEACKGWGKHATAAVLAALDTTPQPALGDDERTVTTRDGYVTPFNAQSDKEAAAYKAGWADCLSEIRDEDGARDATPAGQRRYNRPVPGNPNASVADLVVMAGSQVRTDVGSEGDDYPLATGTPSEPAQPTSGTASSRVPYCPCGLAAGTRAPEDCDRSDCPQVNTARAHQPTPPAQAEEVAAVIAAVEATYPPYNYELRYDGTEDPISAAYVEAFREVDNALDVFRAALTPAQETDQ